MKELRWGFVDKTGKFVIEPKFVEARGFSEGLACVSLDGEKYGYIDKTGRFVISPQYDFERSFKEGLANMQFGYRTCFIDKTGKAVIAPNCEYATNFQEGLAKAKYRREYGFIDKTGSFAIEPKYEDVYDFHEGLARIIYDRKFIGSRDGTPRCGYIDKTGRVVVEPKYKYLPGGIGFSEGLAWIVIGKGGTANKDDKYGFVDKTGRMVIDAKFQGARDFHEGLAWVRLEGQSGFIDKTGRFVLFLENKFGFVGDFSDGYALVECNGKYGFINTKGELFIDTKFDCASDFKDGIALVEVGGKRGYIDKRGVYIIEPIFVEASDWFIDGLSCVKVEIDIAPAMLKEQRPVVTMSSAERPQSPTNPRSQSKSSSGCYIATAVYGSYDCPEVWTLRRYRDNVLDNTWYGRAFIRTYYAISPTLVRWFGKTNWFRNMFFKPLSRWVERLNKRGFEDTPYNDKY